MASTLGFDPGPHWWEASAVITSQDELGEGTLSPLVTER